MKPTLTLVLCALLLEGTLHAQPQIAAKFVYRSHTFNGATLPYRLFIPQGYSSSNRYPVILMLHSAGDRGTDNNLQLSQTRMATCWADSTAQLKHPCFVVAPQVPLTGGWTSGLTAPIRPELAVANDILDSLAREFPVDTNRYYVTGFSMGGSGTWEILLRFPGRFAAAVPMAGGTAPGYAAQYADAALWNFHGTADAMVPVMYSRVMMDSLRAVGRTIVYTHCHNMDCTGLPDSAITMQVRSHADVLYTEIPNTGHTYGIWGTAANYPFLPDWLFDKYRKNNGVISLSSLKSYTTLTGSTAITWTTTMGDSVEIWFSPDAGSSWKPVTTVPNTGTFTWNSSTVPDCAFGSFKLFLKNSGGFIVGSDRSSFFAVKNTLNGLPFARLLNEEFTAGIPIAQDSLDLSILAGDPSGASLAASLLYSADGGSTFSQFDAYTAATNPLPQTRRLGLGALPNSSQAVIRLSASNGKTAAVATSFPFAKITTRLPGTAVARTAGASGASVAVHVVSRAALTGHRYQVKFDDTSSARKEYTVRDLDRGAVVVQHATELDGVKEGPLFDGIRLVIADVTVPRVIADSTRWIKGSSTLKANVRVPDGGKPNFHDYRITLSSTVADTSKGGFGAEATPMKFVVWNLTKDRKAAVAFYDFNGDNTVGPDARIDILEPDSAGTLGLAWSLVFVGQAGDLLPVPGDQYILRTVKPLTSSDQYEFTGTVSAVRPGPAPLAFTLEQNYPNPFNPATTIRFGLAKAVDVRLIVYDILGRRVALLADERMGAGTHEVRFNATGLASGVYFYCLHAGSFSETRKLLLVR